jgi:signal transduction histidine kinase
VTWLLLLLLGLLLLCVVLLAILGHSLWRITRELTYINRQETNALVTSDANWRLLRRLTQAINVSLKQNRALKRQQVQAEQRTQTMLANLTHDIKTPLTVATGYVQLLQQKQPADPRLEHVAYNLTSVNYYLQHLADYTGLQAQTQQPTLAVVDLTQVVKTELFAAYDELTAHQLTLDLSALGNRVEWTSDAARLRRIIQNLIGNWLKYATGQLRVRVAQPDAQHAIIHFDNQVQGPLPDITRLTERFYTGDPARQDSSGLGLSIVQALMLQLNGRLILATDTDWFRVTLQFRRA